MKRSTTRNILTLLFLLCAAIVFGIISGSLRLSFIELLDNAHKQILCLRVTRIILGIVAGAGLAVCGATLQAILRNPLAEPYLLGSSSGAGLGAVIGIAFGSATVYLPFTAFAGALASIIIVYTIAREGNRIPAQSLVLAGVIVAISLSGIVAFLVSISSNEAIHSLLWWLLGSLQLYDVKLLTVITVIVLFGIFTIHIFALDLNAISLGEEEAIHLGINIETVKKILFFVTSLITGAIVSVTGIIGFVGLIIPHVMRLLVGPNHKILLPASCLAGAAFLVACDALSRSLFPPIEIPIGVITSLIGAPIFIALLKRKQKTS